MKRHEKQQINNKCTSLKWNLMITQQQEQFQDLQVTPDSAFYHFWTAVFSYFHSYNITNLDCNDLISGNVSQKYSSLSFYFGNVCVRPSPKIKASCIWRARGTSALSKNLQMHQTQYKQDTSTCWPQPVWAPLEDVSIRYIRTDHICNKPDALWDMFSA